MKVTGKRFIDNLERVAGIIPHFESLVLRHHGGWGVSKPLDYSFKFPFDREMHPDIFEACVDAIVPEDFNFQAKFPVVEDQTFEGRFFTKIGIEYITFSWWTINLVTIQVGFHTSYLRKLLETNAKERWTRNALSPRYEDIINAVARFETPAWIPQTVRTGGGTPTQTRFSGDPWLPNAVAWPLDQDGEPMLFVAQFNLGSLPDEMQASVGDKGMISVFTARCPLHAYDELDGDSPDNKLFRFTLDEPGGVRENAVAKEFRAEASTVAAWFAEPDFPDRADLVGELLDLPNDIKTTIQESPDDTFGTTNAHSAALYYWGVDGVTDALAKKAGRLKPIYGNKLGGWPCWTDSSLWKSHEGTPMTPFFQFDAADGLGLGYPVWLRANLFVDHNDPQNMKMTGWQNG
jgi:uncharacterized protein YwqG